MILLDALNGKNFNSPPPVWLMRQAGRYLPEYLKLREKHSLQTLFHQPELAVEVALMPLKRFELDGAILFSDILTLLEVFGVKTVFEEGRGPILTPRIEHPSQVDALQYQNISHSLSFVFQIIRQLKETIHVPLFGFSGAPFTLAAYLIEGQSSKTLNRTKRFLYTYPKAFKKLISLLTKAVIEYLECQILAGVDALQLFDTWAGMLAVDEFKAFSCEPLKKIQEALKNKVPLLYFSLGNSTYYSHLHNVSCKGLSMDSACNLSSIRKSLPHTILQGNLDPSILFSTPTMVQEKTRKILSQMENDPAFIFNLGHGILPKTPIENVHALVRTVKEAACLHSG